MEIKPGAAFSYRCELTIHSAGPFAAPITIFLEDNGIREVSLSCKGTAIAPEGKPDAKPDP